MAKRAARRPGKTSPKKPSGGAARGGGSRGATSKGATSKSKPSKGKPAGKAGIKSKRVKGGRATVTEEGVYARPGQKGRLPDARPSNDPAGQPKRRSSSRSKTAVNLPPREGGERLQKLMAAAGVASRRECEQFILEGRVQVDGEVITELGVRIDPIKQQIAVDGEALPKTRRLYFAVNKPDGVVCTARDPAGRPRITDLLPPDVGRVFNVGRLDMASEGLILLTNDGELANQLTHPKHGVEKIYHVQVQGHPTGEILGSLRKGVYLAEGKAHFVHAKVKSRRKSGSILEVVLDEGRNREIRRVLARVGHKVQRLTRIAVGPVRLADLPQGAYRPLTPEEVKALRRAVAEGSKPKEEKEPGSAPSRSASSHSGTGHSSTSRSGTGRSAPKRTGGSKASALSASGSGSQGESGPKTPRKRSSGPTKVSTSTRRPAKRTPRKEDENLDSPKPRRTILGEVEPKADKPSGNQRRAKSTDRNASGGNSGARKSSARGRSAGSKSTGGKSTGGKPARGKNTSKKRGR